MNINEKKNKKWHIRYRPMKKPKKKEGKTRHIYVQCSSIYEKEGKAMMTIVIQY